MTQPTTKDEVRLAHDEARRKRDVAWTLQGKVITSGFAFSRAVELACIDKELGTEDARRNSDAWRRLKYEDYINAIHDAAEAIKASMESELALADIMKRRAPEVYLQTTTV